MSISSGSIPEDTPARLSAKLPFDVCFPAHLKYLLRGLSQSAQQGQTDQFQQYVRLTLDFLMRYWAAAALGALERLQGSSIPIPPEPDWAETLKLLRYAVMAWEGHPQSSFRTLLRLGFFEAGDPPRPRLQCRWLGIAGEWSNDSATAERSDVWDEDYTPLPGAPSRYLEVISDWLRASRPLFVKLIRRYQQQQSLVIVTLEDGRGKQLPLLPAPPWRRYAPSWELDQILLAEAATTLGDLPTDPVEESPSSEWYEESLADILGGSTAQQQTLVPPTPAQTAPEPPPQPEAILEPMFEPLPPLPSPVPRESQAPISAGPSLAQPPLSSLDDGLDALLGLDAPRVTAPARWRPRPLEFPGTLPTGVRRQMEVARRSVLDYSNVSQESDAARRNLASGLLLGLSCLLEITARVACAGLAQVAPLPEPLRVALRQPVPATQSVKLLHFAWTALQEYPKQVATALLQAVFFELSAPDVPRLHARWLGLPDAPMIGLQHVTLWVRLNSGQIQIGPAEFQTQLRELLDTLQLWLVAGSPLWSACDPELYIRPDGHWSGYITLAGERFMLDPDTQQEETLEVLLARWRQACSSQRPPFFVLDEVLEFVESVASGSGLMIQGPAAVGKSFLLRDLIQRQPQIGTYRYGWLPVCSTDTFALEQLNWSINELHQQGFPWHALGPAALADLQRHSPREHLFSHYFSAMQERNQDQHESVRLVLLEDHVGHADDLLWCHLNLPNPFVWVGVCEEELPAAWTAPCPPARLPIAKDDLAYQKLELDFLQQNLDWQRSQLMEFIQRSGDDLLVQRLWVGAIDTGMVAHSKDLPEADATIGWVLSQVLEDRVARPVVFLLSVGEDGLPLEELTEGMWAQSLRGLLQHYSWLVVERGESRICLRHPRLWQAVVDLETNDRRETIAQFCQYLVVKLNTTGELNINLEELLQWIACSQAGEAAWTALQSEDFRRWKDEQIHHYDSTGQGHRKIQLVGSWLGVLDVALQWSREHSPLQLHKVLEEQLWSYSSRGLTYRGLGRLHEALLDVEQAIAGFRPLVDQRPELTNGLAAAFNRRSEILRELGRHGPALQDADEAIRMYADIATFDAPRWEPLWALALHHRSMLHQEMGRLQEAEGDLKRSLDHYQPHRDQLRSRMRMDLVQAYLSRASLAARRGDGLLARDDGLRCLELLQRFHESWTELRVLEAQTQTQLAEAHRLLEDEGKALEASDQATSLWKELIDEGRLDLRGVYAQELCRRGQLLYDVGQLDAAFEAAQSSVDHLLRLVETEGRGDLATWLSQALLLRGKMWQRRGRAESARRDLSLAFHYVTNQAGQWGQQANNPAVNVLVDTVVLLSQLSLQMGQADQAVEQLQTCLQYVNLGIEHTQMENRALLESLLGGAQPVGEEALASHDRALELYNQLVDDQGHYQLLPRLAEAHLGRARTHRMLGQEEAALADANQAVDLLTFLSQKGGDPEVLRLLPPARFRAAEILGSLGQKERALEHLQGGLADLELMESEFGRAEYSLERARALALQASLVDDESAALSLSEALLLIGNASREGAETQFLEAEVRRQRAEVLLRLGHTSEAIEELLGQPGNLDNEARLEQIGSLLETMLNQARGQLQGESHEGLVQAYDRVIQIAELLRQGDQSGQVVQMLIRAYQERALARWNPELPEAALDDLGRAIATCAVEAREGHALMAGLLESRARLCLTLGRTTTVLADASRALECLSLASPPDAARLVSLLWLRVRAEPDDAAVWLDLRQLDELLNATSNIQAWTRLKRAQAAWLDQRGWPARASSLVSEAISGLQQACINSSGEQQLQLTREILQWMMERFRQDGELKMLMDWAMWLGDQLERHPELGDEIDIKPVFSWFEEASINDQERFSQIWLALLAEHSDLPQVLFEMVPSCAGCLRLDDFDSSTWISLIDIMDRRAADDSLARLTWEGKTLDYFLSLPRAEVSQNPDLEMALADCLRRWVDLPAHRLALAGVSAEALATWLEG